jgi:hypothetical protein
MLARSAARRGATVLALLVAMGLACVDGAQQKAKQQSLRMASSEVRSAAPPPAEQMPHGCRPPPERRHMPRQLLK